MRSNISKLAFTAALMLAITFTLSCSDGGGGDDTTSSNSGGGLSSPSGGGSSSPSCGSGGWTAVANSTFGDNTIQAIAFGNCTN